MNIAVFAPATALPVAHSALVFDEHSWIEMFRTAGYTVKVNDGVIFVDLADSTETVPRIVSTEALAWQRRTPDWKKRVIAALAAEKPFTAADYLAIERMVGHTVSYSHDEDGKLWICVCYLGRKRGNKKVRDAHIAGLWRFRAWEAVTPDWKEQVRDELIREGGAA
ncbi:hypothetical protein LMIY3S_03663 [Labrys miyagiensis]